MSATSPLKYRRNQELRQELVGVVSPGRQQRYATGYSGIVKADLLKLCRYFGVTYDETPTLPAIYGDLNSVAGTNPDQPAGQKWGMRRVTLKRLLTIAAYTDGVDQ